MRGVNKAILVGNIGQDPETKYMPNGKAVANCSLATSEEWNNKDTGNKESRTEWHKLTFYGRLAEIVAEYIRKGSKIYVEGKLQTRSWEQDGVKRYSTEVIVSEMQMLDSKESGQSSQTPANRGQSSQPAAQPVTDSFEDSIPF